MSFLNHEINMTGSGEEVGGLLVDSFELVSHLEDLDCRIEAGADRRKRIWCGDHHLKSIAKDGSTGRAREDGLGMNGALDCLNYSRAKDCQLCAK